MSDEQLDTSAKQLEISAKGNEPVVDNFKIGNLTQLERQVALSIITIFKAALYLNYLR
jgi:hypothetical protein